MIDIAIARPLEPLSDLPVGYRDLSPRWLRAVQEHAILASIVVALFSGVQISGVPVFELPAALALALTLATVKQSPSVVGNRLFRILIMCWALLLLGAVFDEVLTKGPTQWPLFATIVRTGAFYAFPIGMLVSKGPIRPRLVRAYGLLAILIYAVFILGLGAIRYSEVFQAILDALRTSDPGLINAVIFRDAASYWNELVGQQIIVNPTSFRNRFAEHAVLMFFLVNYGSVPKKLGGMSSLQAMFAALALFSQNRAAMATLAGFALVRLYLSGVQQRVKSLGFAVVAIAVISLGPGSGIVEARLAGRDTDSYAGRTELLEHYIDQVPSRFLYGSDVKTHLSGLPAHNVVVDWAIAFGGLGLVAGLILVIGVLRMGRYSAGASNVFASGVGFAVLVIVRIFTSGGANLSSTSWIAVGVLFGGLHRLDAVER